MSNRFKAVDVAKEVRKVDPTFGLLLDLSHLPMQRETSKDALMIIRDYISHAHIGNCYIKDKNNPAYGDHLPRFGYPGSENDVAELTEYIRMLLDIGYIGEGSGFVNFLAPGGLEKAATTNSEKY